MAPSRSPTSPSQGSIAAQPSTGGAPAASSSTTPSVSRRQTLRNFELFDAPHVAIVTTEEPLGAYGAVDCGAYVSNFMTAAQSFGVATIAQAALAVHSRAIRAHFGMAEDRRVVCGISFGLPDVSHPVNGYRTVRAGLDEVVTWAD
jgi:nitroreductase